MAKGISLVDLRDVYHGPMISNEQSATDPCSVAKTFSAERFSAFLLLFVVGFGVACVLFFLLSDTSYGTQLATAIGYTAAVIIYGFARNRGGIPPYLFTCPVVVSQYPRLLTRHAGFLAVVILLETIALRIKPHLSSWWFTSSGRNWTPFFTAVALPVCALAITEVMTNRGVLKRAHQAVFGEPPAEDAPRRDNKQSIFGPG